MRCEDCGRTIQNAEMWQLSGDRGAPPAKSMKSLCWTCREAMSPLERPLPLEGAVVEQARAVVRGYESAQ